MPKAHVEGRYDLKPVLAALGVRTLTDPAAADLSGVDGGAGHLYVDAAVQQVFLDVDEQGTEAAAATAYGSRLGSSYTTRPKPFVVDRPFAFALRDTRTGLVLFCGHVTDPRGNAATGR
jgi:serpin B